MTILFSVNSKRRVLLCELIESNQDYQAADAAWPSVCCGLLVLTLFVVNQLP